MAKARAKTLCPKCNREISNSNIAKHLKAHETNPNLYLGPRFALTHDGLVCQFCSKMCKNRNSLCNHERLCNKNPNKQIIDHSDYYASHTAWNKGLTAETDERVRRNTESVRKYYEDNPNIKRKPLSEAHKAKISATINNKVVEGTWHASLARNMHYNYRGIDLHGMWELRFAEWLDVNNIEWRRPSESFTYTFEGVERQYTPDFYLIDSNTYIEIKGYKTDKDQAKWEQFPENLMLRVLMADDLLALGLDINT
jgi:hypothetical protein